MQPTSRLTSKGQTTIPREVRQKLSLRPGDVLVYELDDDEVRVSQANAARCDVSSGRADHAERVGFPRGCGRLRRPLSSSRSPFVPFPFVDAPRTKPRPALVLSVRTFNRQNGHTLLAMITTAEHTRWPSDYPIHDLRPTGLRVDCVVRWKLFTLDNRAPQRRIGHLGERDTHGCRAALAGILDWGRFN